MRPTPAVTIVALLLSFVALAACAPTATGTSGTSGSKTPAGAIAVQKPVPPETNPPGDIPDSQAFVRVQTPYLTLRTPEGWSRSTASASTTFTDKLNTIVVSWAPAAKAPTVASVRAADVPDLKRTTPAFELGSVKAVDLPAGPAVLAEYRINSSANPVTGKEYRLDVQRYTLWHKGTRMDLTLLSPVGADNVDPWRIVSRSVRWR